MRPLAATLEARALALMERVLRGGAPLAAEYPLVFGERAPGRIVALEEEGEVRSACAILPREIAAGPFHLRAGLIGSVATDPDHRRLGWASRVLDLAERELAHEGCAIALLWADDPAFYAGRGYRPVGCEIDHALELAAASRAAPRTGARAAAPDDSGAIHRLYARHRHRVERTPEETAALLSGPGVETLVLQRERGIAAYACMGRGEDLQRAVHEWGGAPEDVLALVGEHARRSLLRGEHEPLFVMSPESAKRLHGLLEGAGAAASRGVLGMGKVLDVAALADVLAMAAPPEARVSIDASAHQGAPTLAIHGPAGRRALESEDLLDLLLPATSERSAIAASERELDLRMPAMPLGAFVWGLDSI